MFDIFKKKENRVDIFIKITCLLVHAAKIDEIYTDKERDIIKKTILNLGIEKNEIEKILDEAENIESNSNQLLEFTREIKQLKQEDKPTRPLVHIREEKPNLLLEKIYKQNPIDSLIQRHSLRQQGQNPCQNSIFLCLP